MDLMQRGVIGFLHYFGVCGGGGGALVYFFLTDYTINTCMRANVHLSFLITCKNKQNKKLDKIPAQDIDCSKRPH